MWRAFFFAIGTMLVIVGVECLLIESATLTSEKVPAAQVRNGWLPQQSPVQVGTNRVVHPPEWIPWSLIASGTVVLLYALTLPSRWGNKPSE